jgi:hypothetical protein
MIILNETIIIDDQIHEEWLTWINTVYIPRVMQTGLFTSNRVLNVLNSPNEGITHCIQFTTDSLDNYHRFTDGLAVELQNAHQQQFENKFVRFETIMQLVAEYESNNHPH